jgi:hypothetical protein
LDCSVSNPERFIVFAGVFGESQLLSAFSVRWQELLDQFDLPYLHMAEALTFTESFAAWPLQFGGGRAERRDSLLRQAVELINSSGLKPIGFGVDIALLPHQKQRAERKKKLFDAVVDQLLALHFTNLANPPSIAILCDREQDLHPKFLVWLQKLQSGHQATYARISGLCLMNSRALASLQAADLVASLMRSGLEAAALNQPRNPLLTELAGKVFQIRTVSGGVLGTNPEQPLWEIIRNLKASDPA